MRLNPRRAEPAAPAADTRTRLVLAAEALFAERGLEGVSLREINRAAGQNNASALHYHFGSRDAVIEAIVALRMPPVDAHRLALLAEPGRDDPAGLAEALVAPLAAVAREPAGRNNWLRFQAQLYNGGCVDLRAIALRLDSNNGLRLLAHRLRAALPGLPTTLLASRLTVSLRHAVYALAGWQNGALWAQHGLAPERLDLFEADLVDTVAAALAAPPGPRSRALLGLAAPAGAAPPEFPTEFLPDAAA